jgi:hypothetical protein
LRTNRRRFSRTGATWNCAPTGELVSLQGSAFLFIPVQYFQNQQAKQRLSRRERGVAENPAIPLATAMRDGDLVRAQALSTSFTTLSADILKEKNRALTSPMLCLCPTLPKSRTPPWQSSYYCSFSGGISRKRRFVLDAAPNRRHCFGLLATQPNPQTA